MPSSYTNLHFHIIFATKGRKPFLQPEFAQVVHTFLGGGIRARGGTAVRINGTVDHVHILAGLRADVALSDLMRDLKANSSGWIHRRFAELADFNWQVG